MLARDKMFLQKELGGYGIVDLYKMDMYIKANWIRRWMNNKWIKDYSECICLRGEYNEPDCVNIMDPHSLSDCLASKAIMQRWAEYKGEFYMVGQNVNGAILFNSEFVIENTRPQRIQVFDVVREREFADVMSRIRVSDMLDEQGHAKDKIGMETVLGGIITFAEFFRLRSELYRLRNLLCEDGKAIKTLKNLFKGLTKGSSVLRMAVITKESRMYKNNDVLMHRSILGITNREEELDRGICETHMGIWAKSTLEPGFKDFLYRYSHGRLHVNNTRANFDDVDRWCTFCSMKVKIELRNDLVPLDSQEYRERMERLPVETVRHLFWDCQHTKPHIVTLCNEIGWDNMDSNEFLIGKNEGNNFKNEFGIIIKHWIKYWIYNKKVQERAPRITEMRNNFEKFRQYVLKQNKKYRGIEFNE